MIQQMKQKFNSDCKCRSKRTGAAVSRIASTLVLTVLIAFFSAFAFAGNADVVGGNITSLGDGRYRVEATVKHADTGWDHYADRWDVLSPDGTVLGVRELLHPHENEQPFTRSLTLEIPTGIKVITLQANDSVHGLGGATFELTVPDS